MKKKRSVYGLWLLILFVLFVLFQNTFFGVVFFTYAGMGIISVTMAKVISKNIKVYLQGLSDNVLVGESFIFNVIVNNTSILPSNKIYACLSVKNYFFGEQEEVCMLNIPVTIKGEEIVSSTIIVTDQIVY